jgi:phosphonate degradation associated HDIG domain protein
MSAVEEILELYDRHGSSDYIGEPVSQIEHMGQAARFAEEAGEDDEVILAAFFHDLGHLCEHVMGVKQMDGYGVVDHENIGARYLAERGFSERVTRLVAGHVAAKRYLTFANPSYFAKLSQASRKTLEFQGGRMNADEAAAFERDPLFETYLRLRTWDERAKVANAPLPDLAHYRAMMERHLAR